MAPSALELPDSAVSAQELDPLALLNLGSKSAQPKHQAPKARDLGSGIPDGVALSAAGCRAGSSSPIAGQQHVDSGGLRPACRRRCSDAVAATGEVRSASGLAQAARSALRLTSRWIRLRLISRWIRLRPTGRSTKESSAAGASRRESRPVEIAPPPRERPAAPASAPESTGTLDFGAVLSGAGLDAAAVTPEVAREFRANPPGRGSGRHGRHAIPAADQG